MTDCGAGLKHIWRSCYERVIGKLYLNSLSILYTAAVAELADARDLKSLGGYIIRVRSPSAAFFFFYSRLAQSVEQMTVNHWVVGSSPTAGANKYYEWGRFGAPYSFLLFYFSIYILLI